MGQPNPTRGRQWMEHHVFARGVIFCGPPDAVDPALVDRARLVCSCVSFRWAQYGFSCSDDLPEMDGRGVASFICLCDKHICLVLRERCLCGAASIRRRAIAPCADVERRERALFVEECR